MATSNQRDYIKDLAVAKLKEFKEFKEMVRAKGIVGADAKTVDNAVSIDGILDVTTDLQASKIIEELEQRETPVRARAYSQKRSERVIELLDKVKATADDWSFDELR